jgi:small subunit ribosomal protein S6e
VQVSGHHANSLIGKKIGDEVDGIFISLPGYKLQIEGGTDKNGFAMRRDFPGVGRRRLLLSKGKSFRPKENGMRKKKSVRGNTISQEIVQINMKVIKHSSRPIEKLITVTEKKDEGQESTEEQPAAKPQKEEKPSEEPSQEEKPKEEEKQE